VVGEVGHFIDFISYLTGSLVTTVSATAPRDQRGCLRDTVHVALELGDGSAGMVHYCSTGNAGLSKEYIEVSGGGISAVLDNFRNLRLYGASVRGKRKYLNQVKGFKQEAASFVDHLRRGDSAPISFESLYNTTKATLLIQAACNSGERLSVGATPAVQTG
jgi:predicted dehydrogenase